MKSEHEQLKKVLTSDTRTRRKQVEDAPNIEKSEGRTHQDLQEEENEKDKGHP